MGLSDDHWDVSKWQKRIKATEAKVLYVSGDDNVPLDWLNDGSFIGFSTRPGVVIFIEREYALELAHNQWQVRGHVNASLQQLLDGGGGDGIHPDQFVFQLNLGGR